MKTSELIKEIERLPVQKRILVIEKTIYTLRKHEDNNQMVKAANLLSSDYKTDSELTALTKLDFEDFYEAR
ncbi:MAG TPA: hypothetical protein VIK10_04365 [Prolixibacteraceae bacterium]